MSPEPSSAQQISDQGPDQRDGSLPPPEQQSGDGVLEPNGAREPAAKSKKTWIIAAVVVAVFVIGGGIVAVTSGNSSEKTPTGNAKGKSSDSTPVADAAESCGLERAVGDNGSSISIDTQGADDTSGDDIADLTCFLAALEVPDRVLSRMEQTRALDGTLDAAWDDYEAFWNYHPDSGLSLTVYEAE